MKKIIFAIVAVVLAFGAVKLWQAEQRERVVVILSTNDIHARLDNFARLATAVTCCRDTVATILVDAGDRWTGNTFVDRAESRRPILDLMNSLDYDVACVGNHEFDCGLDFLLKSLSVARFPIICANLKGNAAGKTSPSKVVTASNGVRIGFVGVVTNYDNGHPDGAERIFRGIEFPDPQQAARSALSRLCFCDAKVLLSHMGDTKDVEFATKGKCCDAVIGGHTHQVVDTIVCGTPVGQTGCRLVNVGATTIRLRGHRVVEATYRNISLKDYPEDVRFVNTIREIESNPEFISRIGSLGCSLDRIGFADLHTTILTGAVHAEVGFYHYGGIRQIEREAGPLSIAAICDCDPFNSTIYTMRMTPKQMRQMIIAKFNDRNNVKESHRVDLFCTAPYTILTDSTGEAVDVLFPSLNEEQTYRVALPNYVAEKYPAIEAEEMVDTGELFVDAAIEYVRKNSPVIFSNSPRQHIERQR